MRITFFKNLHKKRAYIYALFVLFLFICTSGCSYSIGNIEKEEKLFSRSERLKIKREKRLALRQSRKQGNAEKKKIVQFDLHNGDEDVLITGPFRGDAEELTFYTFSGAVTTYSEKGKEFGASLAVGDINGDGAKDLLIGSPNRYPHSKAMSKKGAVYLLQGINKNKGILTDSDYSLFTSSPKDEPLMDHMGNSIAISDLNRDGVDDTVIGAPFFINPKSKKRTGAVFVFLGNKKGNGGSISKQDKPDMSLFGSGENSMFGYKVATGDITGDGYPDLIVGAPGEKSSLDQRQDAGSVYVFFNKGLLQKSGQVSDLFDIQLKGSKGEEAERMFSNAHAMGDYAGSSLAVCDLNGDSIDDFLIGVPGFDGGNTIDAGGVYVVYGNKNAKGVFILKDKSDVFFEGTVSFGNAGFEVSCFDKSSKDSSVIFISAPFALDEDLKNISGSVFIIKGSPLKDHNLLDSANTLILRGRSPEERSLLFFNKKREVYYFGSTLAVGDFNGDGKKDIAIGAPATTAKENSNRVMSGEVFIVFGSFENSGYQFIGNAADIIIYGGSEKNMTGASLAVGDLNNDGIDDLVVGAPGSRGESKNIINSGEAYVMYGQKIIFDFLKETP